MHGRLKVRTTAEQDQRKKLEREKKLEFYKLAMNSCLDRIKAKNENSNLINKKRICL